jgi:hypothetical protein
LETWRDDHAVICFSLAQQWDLSEAAAEMLMTMCHLLWVVILGWELLARCPQWQEVAKVLMEAGGSLQFGSGRDFEDRAWIFFVRIVAQQRCERLGYTANLPAEALCEH